MCSTTRKSYISPLSNSSATQTQGSTFSSLKCMYTVGNEQGRKELWDIKETPEAHAQRSFQSHFKIKCLKSGFNLQFKI